MKVEKVNYIINYLDDTQTLYKQHYYEIINNDLKYRIDLFKDNVLLFQKERHLSNLILKEQFNIIRIENTVLYKRISFPLKSQLDKLIVLSTKLSIDKENLLLVLKDLSSYVCEDFDIEEYIFYSDINLAKDKLYKIVSFLLNYLIIFISPYTYNRKNIIKKDGLLSFYSSDLLIEILQLKNGLTDAEQSKYYFLLEENEIISLFIKQNFKLYQSYYIQNLMYRFSQDKTSK